MPIDVATADACTLLFSQLVAQLDDESIVVLSVRL